MNYRDGNDFLTGVNRARRWILNMKSTPSNYGFLQWRSITIDVHPGGPLSQFYLKGKKSLIPIVFSHGLTGARHCYSTYAREMASNGYLVFLMDHHDGSCCYTQDHEGKVIPFDSSVPFFNYKDMHDKVVLRENEIKSLVDYISKENFVTSELNFEEGKAKIALDQLVVAGHSFGGATALRFANNDERARACLTFDPWLAPLHGDIEDGTLSKFK